MNLYNCTFCNFNTYLKSHYTRHIKTSKHTKNTENSTIIQQKLSIDSTKAQQILNIKFCCKYCNKPFKHMQSMYRHIKYSCQKNKDEDLNELVRLMNLQIEKKDEQIESLTKQIEKLMGKLQIQNNFVNSNVIQNNNNIQLLPYKNTDISHLTKKDYINSIKKMNFCVKYLIEKVHFNPDKPENMNIYISNLKNKYIMIYDGNTWTAKDKKTEIDNLFLDKEMLLEQWLEEECYPELKDKFVKYLNNKENDETLNMIKDEIKLMMYNNKSMIEN
jgi:hypothetical protein